MRRLLSSWLRFCFFAFVTVQVLKLIFSKWSVQARLTCYSFFGEFAQNGEFRMVERIEAVQCEENTTNCFLEIYRLEAQTWFNGQCDDLFVCRYDAQYLMPHGCQATLHGGDRCCCTQNRCNFDRILAERPTFKKYLPNEYQEDVLARDEEDHLGKTAQECGKKPKQKGKLASR